MGSLPRLAAVFAAVSVFALTAQYAAALPSYARDSKTACLSCHYKSSVEFGGESSLRKGREVSVALPKDKYKAGVRFYPASSKPDLIGSEPKGVGGVSGYLASDLFTASVGWSDPSASGDLLDLSGAPEDMWYKLSLTPSLMGVNFSFGLFGAGNSQSLDGDAPVRIRVGKGPGGISLPVNFSAMGVDAGFSGMVGGLSLDLQTMYFGGSAPYNGQMSWGGPGAFSAKAQLGVGEDYGVSAAYSKYSLSSGGAGVPEKAASIGAWLKIKDNIRIMPEYTIYGPERKWLDKGSGEFYLRFFTGF